MLTKAPLLALALATVTSPATAMLIPPEIAAAPDAPTVSALSELNAPNNFMFKMALVSCPGCTLPVYEDESHKSVLSVPDVDNHLSIYINVESEGQTSRLLANGFELYPNMDPLRGSFHAYQFPNRRDLFDEKKYGGFLEVPLGYSLQMHSIGHDVSNGMEVLSLRLRIFQVNNVFVEGIPAVNIRLITTPKNTLMIGRVEIDGVEGESATGVIGPISAPESGHKTPTSDADHDSYSAKKPHHSGHHNGHHGQGHAAQMAEIKKQLSACTNFLCRWKVILGAHLKPQGCGGSGAAVADGMRGKGHHSGHHSRPMQEADNSENDGRHHHHHHNGHHDHHYHDDTFGQDHRPFHGLRHHTLAKLVEKFSSHILFPILAGIAAGVLVSLFGMMIGTLIVSLYRLFFARGRPNHERLHRHQRHQTQVIYVEEGVDEEKAGLMAAAEPTESLPEYKEDTPAKTDV